MPRKDPNRTERGPKLNEPVCIGEEVKIAINLSVNRFRFDPSQKELSFPSSLSAVERAYVHRLCQELGSLKSRSRGSGPNRCITVTKSAGDGESTSAKPCRFSFELVNCAREVKALMDKYPLSAKEKQDLMLSAQTEQQANELNKDRIHSGRLTNFLPQVPPRRQRSDLEHFRHGLPVYQMRGEISEGINSSNVILIAGETGSGKTTQVPQIILDNHHESQQVCRILCTQPRRIAAVSIAERVAMERGERAGQSVGYQIRLDSKVSSKTVLTFCTTGVLLRTLMGGDECLDTVTHVIVDEVHERDRFSDFLLLCLKEILPRRPNLHVILMSATLNMDLFSNYFGQCKVVCVPGSLYPVEEFFLEDILKWTGYRNKAMEKAMSDRCKMKVKEQQEVLSEWCAQKMSLRNSTSTPCSSTEEESDVTTSDNAELGEEKEDLEPWVIEEMDRLLKEAWLSGNEAIFHQILHLISSESISVDYVQTESGITPLMIAASRGFINVVDHLLSLGASVNLTTNHGWTALDFARKFERANVIAMMEAHVENQNLESGLDKAKEEEAELVSAEDRQLLNLYHNSFDDDKVDINLVTTLIWKIHSSRERGAVLVFLPGYDEIVAMHAAITEDQRFEPNSFVIYPLHSTLQYSDQKRVFLVPPKGVRKIILSTNIAETSVTINDVVFVVDCGKIKEKTFDALSSFTTLKSNWISKASALQRKGRAGRCQEGKCYHLFSRPRYIHLQDYQTPEILRLPLQELCLHTKLLAPTCDSIADFLAKCPQAPPQLVIRNAVQVLKQIDGLDTNEELTMLGHHLSDLAVEPRLGKMLLYAVVLKCLDPVLTIVCSLANKDPFVLPFSPSEKRMANEKRKKFSEETYSDHMTLLRVFQAWQKARAEGWERAFCKQNYVSSATMEMLCGMRFQILGQLKASGFLKSRGPGDIRDLNTNSDSWALVKGCLVAGTYPNIIRREGKELTTATESHVRFHNSSAVLLSAPSTKLNAKLAYFKTVKNLPSEWLIYEEMSRVQTISTAKVVSVVSPASVFLFAGSSKLGQNAIDDSNSKDNDKEEEDDGEEEEDREAHTEGSHVYIDEWLAFVVKDVELLQLSVELRMKWHSLFLAKMKSPSKPWTQADEALVHTVTMLLSNAEKQMGLENPQGVGQRPRQTESPFGHVDDFYGRSGGGGGNHQRFQQQQQYRRGNRGGGARYQNQGWTQGLNNGGNSRGGSNQGTALRETPEPVASPGRAKDPGNVRFFLLKSPSAKYAQASQKKGVWTTNASLASKLDKSFKSGHTVYVVLSLQSGNHFQGCAVLRSVGTSDKHPDLPGQVAFKVEWVKKAQLSFHKINHLSNPWNDYKRVTVTRNGEEIEPGVGVTLLQNWDKYIGNHGPVSAASQSDHGNTRKFGKSSPKGQLQDQRSAWKDEAEGQHGRESRKQEESGGRDGEECEDKRSEASLPSSSSPAPSLHTGSSKSSSRSSSPGRSHSQSQSHSVPLGPPFSALNSGAGLLGGVGLLPVTQTQFLSQPGVATLGGSYHNSFQQQPGLLGQGPLGLATAVSGPPTMMVGGQPELSPMMILQRNPSAGAQSQLRGMKGRGGEQFPQQ